jgi:hypothetical protein
MYLCKVNVPAPSVPASDMVEGMRPRLAGGGKHTVDNKALQVAAN